MSTLYHCKGERLLRFPFPFESSTLLLKRKTEEAILKRSFNLYSIESSLVQIRTMTVSRHEASKRFLDRREGHGDERPVSWGARKLYQHISTHRFA
jgi:hypothetical protein